MSDNDITNLHAVINWWLQDIVPEKVCELIRMHSVENLSFSDSARDHDVGKTMLLKWPTCHKDFEKACESDKLARRLRFVFTSERRVTTYVAGYLGFHMKQKLDVKQLSDAIKAGKVVRKIHDS